MRCMLGIRPSCIRPASLCSEGAMAWKLGALGAPRRSASLRPASAACPCYYEVKKTELGAVPACPPLFRGQGLVFRGL